MYLALVDRISRHRTVIADNDVIGGMTRALISFPHLPKETPCDLVFECDADMKEWIMSESDRLLAADLLPALAEFPEHLRGIPIVIV